MSNGAIDWGLYPNFNRSEFVCKETGECNMQAAFLAALQKVRTIHGKPMIISSGYRSIEHSVERIKRVPGEHCAGLAADILICGVDALKLLDIAINQGFKRIGINQKGEFSQRYIHLSISDRFGLRPAALWTY